MTAPVIDIAYVRYQAPDLDRMEAFLLDFGLHRAARTDRALDMCAADGQPVAHVSELGEVPRTLGFGLRAASADHLAHVARQVGVPVEDNPEPGGGQRVRFTDPSGFAVDLLHGQQRLPPLPGRDPLAMNTAVRRTRLGQPVRLKPQPSQVMRLGHVALLVADFAAAHAFYRDVLGLRASDTYWAGVEDNTIAAFMHCGLGEQFTDHHTVALISAQDGVSRFDHAAFEVLDFDDLVQGNAFLKAREHRHSWGIGRHVQGSQIFDYWRDPFGHKIEHWTDGDLVNDRTPVGHAALAPDELQQWAPPLTPDFFN